MQTNVSSDQLAVASVRDRGNIEIILYWFVAALRYIIHTLNYTYKCLRYAQNDAQLCSAEAGEGTSARNDDRPGNVSGHQSTQIQTSEEGNSQ